MRKLPYIILLIVLFSVCTNLFLQANSSETKKLRHVVAFKFKPGITPEQMQKATKDFLQLKTRIPQIMELEGGPDVAIQNKNGKFTHCFVVTVKNQEDLNTYGEHPIHKAFSQSVDPLLAEVMVVDYWAE
ncbi:Dabb family protein [Adhaeribacter radiodurans]|uniref:Dabb family protein n=1 Tax=Adhaeribacter radiodurans TaxID=2745197 RepID=A0A7L7L9N5_9BACT|nr:Dabb family protein [Adhaeribacter radiodurans]QMU29540.1 Dabb family protein [Adhaeribacter radiodurans]